MSNFLAFAHVTAALQAVIQRALHDAVPGVSVIIGWPNRPVATNEPYVVLELHHISAGVTPRRPDIGRPERTPLPLNLHYRVAFSRMSHGRLTTEIMIARVLGTFHAVSVLTDELLRSAVLAEGPAPFLSGSDLAGPLRITPEFPTREDIHVSEDCGLCLHYVVSPILLDAVEL